ncbi:helix-turn-helix domain-containing protein [Streptomyces sp. OE57]|uniref:helix-turn-helix domain-containing protein n=1 Tax=Streptomyces lacaronensis TaxID=3379885 RepID=UPI0039B76AA1
MAIDDPLVRMIRTSRHFGGEDPVRVRTMPQGRADREVIRYVLAQGVAQWSEPGFIDGRDDLGPLPRYVVPLRECGHLLHLMMILSQRVLTEQEMEAITRAVRVMTAQMYAEHLEADTEQSDARDLLLELLGTSPAARDAARQRALDSGLLKEMPYAVFSAIQVARGQEPPGQTEVALHGAAERFLQTHSAHGTMAIEQDRAILLQVRDRPSDPDELGEQSRRVIEALRAFLDASAAPVGVSVWWSFVDQYGTGRVRRFVAVDQHAAVTAVPWMTVEEQQDSGAIFDMAGLMELGAALAGPDGEKTRQDFVPGMFSGAPDPEMLAFIAEQITSTPPYGGVSLLFDHCAQDWRDALPRIDVPTLLIGCDGSHVNPGSRRFIAEQIPDARLHVFPTDVASSHLPFLENPSAFNVVVEKFLAPKFRLRPLGEHPVGVLMTQSFTTRVPKTGDEQAPDPFFPSGCGVIRILSEMPDGGDDEFLYLGMHVRGSVAITRAGGKVFLEPSDVVFCHPDRRHFLQFGEDCQMRFFRIPRRYLSVSESDLDRILGVPVRHDEGIGALVSDFMSGLAAEAEFHRSTIVDRLARSAVDLLAVLVMELLRTEAAEETSGASKAGSEMLSRIRIFIEEHLTEPDLSPEAIARAHHISVRYLHKLFQNDGTSVSQWVRQRRLDSCRHELGRTSNRPATVAAVAHRWGFSSPSHFSRTFRDAYGMSPSQWQALAASGIDSPLTCARADG